MRQIINVPDKRLRLKSEPITTITQELVTFYQDLAQALITKTDPPGVGLSAIQVGKPYRAFFTYLPLDSSLPTNKWTAETLKLELFLNPEIVAESEKLTLGGNKKNPSIEGCLSIPKIYAPVYRHAWIEMRYHSCPLEALETYTHVSQIPIVTKRFDDFPARVVQHEFDHLEGILFTDHALRDGLPFYMEVDDDLVEIQDPQAIVNW